MCKTQVLLCLLIAAVQLRAASAPPPGIEISEEDRSPLVAGVRALKKQINFLQQSPKRSLLPDVIIFLNAVRYALDDNMFYKPEDVKSARRL